MIPDGDDDGNGDDGGDGDDSDDDISTSLLRSICVMVDSDDPRYEGK